MAQQVRPWLMKPENGRAPKSARKQTGISQQTPSGTAAFAPQQKSGCTAAIETCRPRHAKRSLAKVGGVHVLPFKSEKADIHGGQPRYVWESALYRSSHPAGPTHELMPNLWSALHLAHYYQQFVYNQSQSSQRQRRTHRHEK